MSEIPLQLWDPVSVESSSAQALQGVVAYLGDVDFAPGASDFVGIRLTGASVGLGKNNGIVDGKKYFDAGPNSGIFMRYSSGKISKRILSRLQELQLKRELSIKPSVTALSSTTTPSKSISSLPTTSTNPKTPGPTTIGVSNLNRLEEIRRKREAAAAATNAVKSISKTPSYKSRGKEEDLDAESVASGRSAASSLASGSAAASLSRSARLDELKAEREARVMRSSGRMSASKNTRPLSSISHPRTPGSATKQLEDTFSSEAEQAISEYKEKWKEADDELQKQGDVVKDLKSSLAEALARNEEMEKQISELKSTLTEKEEFKSTNVPVTSAPEPVADSLSQDEYNKLAEEKYDLQRKFDELSMSVESLRRELSENKENHSFEISQLKEELLNARSRALAAEKEVSTIHEQAAIKSSSTAEHMKERAKLSSEISSLKRRILELERAQFEHETMIEEVALDKEALQEEKEELQDRLQESAIELTTLQVELEEVKVELEETKIALEDARQVAASAAASASGEVSSQEGGSSTAADSQDVIRTLSNQNSRFREALVRLREQTDIDKLQLSKKLRDAEKDAAAARELQTEIETLRQTKSAMSSEIKELKEMVDTNAVYETMVEELSDKVTRLEDENIELKNAVRDMEEAGEIAAEMEEVQAEEIKTLRREQQTRDATIRNLEEAIKMQRRREIDLQKAVSDYRTVIDTLKQEKSSLLALREGGEGEKSQLIAASQRALAQASQLVSDQEARRKREANAEFDKINAQTGSYLALRLETFLPAISEISAEVAALKGELLLSKILAKGALTLGALSDLFNGEIATLGDASVRLSAEFENLDEGSYPVMHLNDETYQKIESFLFEANCSQVVVEASSVCSSLLFASQWPGFLSMEDSREIGSTAIGIAPDVDDKISGMLRTLKEEGHLSPHRASVAALSQSLKVLQQTLIDSEDSVVPSKLKNNACHSIIMNVTSAKFTCLAATAAVVSAVKDGGDNDVATPLAHLLEKVQRITKEIDRVMNHLTGLCYAAGSGSEAVATVAKALNVSSVKFASSLRQVFQNEKIIVIEIKESENAAEKFLQCAVNLLVLLKEAGIVGKEGRKTHLISSENFDVWQGMIDLAREEFGDGGTSLLLNGRARRIEQMIANAFNSATELETLKAKATSLEKALLMRTQEIALQTSRVAELEKILSQKSTIDSKVQSLEKLGQDTTSIEALAKLTEENRVLTEAVDVLHAQLDEYEAELRSLKESGGKAASRRGMFSPKVKQATASDLDSTLSLLGQDISEHSGTKTSNSNSNSLKLEASVLRPLLQEALVDAATWRAKVVSSNLSSLTPLSFPKMPYAFGSLTNNIASQPQEGVQSGKDEDCIKKLNLARCRDELILASMESRLSKASIKLVQISKPINTSQAGTKSGRLQIVKQLAEEEKVFKRMENATDAARQCLMRLPNDNNVKMRSQDEKISRLKLDGHFLSATVTIGSQKDGEVFPVSVRNSDLQRLHSIMIQ